MNDGHVPEQPSVEYRETPGGVRLTFNPAVGVRRTCACKATHGYPNTVVLAIDRERRHVSEANEVVTEELMDALETNEFLTEENDYLVGETARLRGVEESQAARIKELEEELHVANGRIARMRAVGLQRAEAMIVDLEAASMAEISPVVESPEPEDVAQSGENAGDESGSIESDPSEVPDSESDPSEASGAS